MMAPLVRRTWSPRGRTPVLHQKTCSHKKVSVIGALCVSPHRNKLNLYFRLYPDANINTAAVIGFLRGLMKELNNHILIVWDRFQPHRAGKVHDMLLANPRLHIEYLPPYAPELNPVEYVWAHTKMNPMANMPVMELSALATKARTHIRSLQKRQSLLRAFVKASRLSLRLK